MRRKPSFVEATINNLLDAIKYINNGVKSTVIDKTEKKIEFEGIAIYPTTK